MKKSSKAKMWPRMRRPWVGLVLVGVLLLMLLWRFSPGLPVLFGPRASAAVKEAGRELFVHEWQPNDPLAHGDGLGPVFNAKSCVACHHQGGIGGGGGNLFNVHNFEVMPNRLDPLPRNGTIHASAIAPAFKETSDLVRKKYPIIKGETRTENHCVITIPDIDPLRTEQVQTTSLFGAGWIDRISEKAILHARRKTMLNGIAKEFRMKFENIPPGRPRVLADGRIGKFGWRAQFATLEEFVAAACSNELGLGTSDMAQARPISRPDFPEAPADLDRAQFRALVAFCDTLPKPVEVTPQSDADVKVVARGKQAFGAIGCAVCHIPDVGGVSGVYSDFLLHSIDDPPHNGGNNYGPSVPTTPFPEGHPKPDEWKTPPLWGCADSAPYLHDGRAHDLRAAILAHGGDAKSVREAFKQLPPEDQNALLAFLGTLKAPPDALPAPQPPQPKRKK